VRNVYNFFIIKTERKIPLGRQEDNSRGDVREIEWEGVNWIRLAGCCKHGSKSSDSIKGGEFLDLLSDS
jgi:hypothetical protein